MGCAAAFDLRLLGVSRHLPARATARHLLNCARTGFRWKLALIAIAGLNALRFHLGPFRTANDWDRGVPTPVPAKVAAAVSLAVWAGAVAAGRLIAYV